jgi:hypothetical protein
LNNSGKDNKNEAILAFGSNLVAKRVFITVTFCFVMVGHIHENIDAACSKVASQTRHTNIETLL